MKIHLVLLLMTIGTGLLGQIKVLDSESMQGIPFVYILNQNGDYISSSNVDGIINDLSTARLSNSDSITIYHISYKPLSLSFKDILSRDKVLLKFKDHELKEIVINARKGKSGYLKISGAFRSYQFYDNDLKFYADGQVDYFGKIRRQKFRNKVKGYRYFENKYLLDEDRGNNINWSEVGVSKIENDFLPDEVFNHNAPSIENLNDSIKLILVNNDTIGKIIQKRGYFIIEMKDFFSKKRRSLFGNTSVLLYRYITLIFRDTGQSIINIDSYENLLYYKVISLHDFHRKGADDGVSIIDMEEIFVDKSQYFQRKGDVEDFNDYSKYHTLNKSGNFSNGKEYITKSRFYYPLPKTISRKTGFKD